MLPVRRREDEPRELADVSPAYKPPIVCQLSTSLPLPLVVNRIPDDETHTSDYWRRRCDATWPQDRTLDQQVSRRLRRLAAACGRLLRMSLPGPPACNLHAAGLRQRRAANVLNMEEGRRKAKLVDAEVGRPPPSPLPRTLSRTWSRNDDVRACQIT